MTSIQSVFKDLKFSNDWFLVASLDIYDTITKNFDINKPISILEIGTYEGQSTISFAYNICKHQNSRITSVDIADNDVIKYNMNSIPLELSSKISLLHGFSSIVLKNIQTKFDIIYIDGSHFPDDVLEDAVLSFQLLSQNGLMFFDDYIFNHEDYLSFLQKDSVDNYLNVHNINSIKHKFNIDINYIKSNNTIFMKDSIDLFSMLYAGRLTPVKMEKNTQTVCFKKTAEAFGISCKFNNGASLQNIESNYKYNKETTEKILKKQGLSTTSMTSINPIINDKLITQQIINTNPIIDQDASTCNLHITETIEQLTLNNTPIDGVALYCPFYISSYNNASWITSWLTNVAQYETVPKFYSISYAPDINIDMYSNLIEKLNEVATCIQIKEKVFHTDALAHAHEYLKNHNFKYMVHIEQDVILTNPVVYHIVNKMIADNNFVAITDIPKIDIFLEDSDIDISIFAINLIVYDNNNYSIYADTDNNIHNLISDEDKLIYTDVTCNTKLPLLKNYSNKLLFDTICKLTKTVYKNGTDHWIYKHMDKLNIKDAINPVYIDSARGYPVHAYLTNKLSIIYNIGSCARHLFASRYHSLNNNFIGIDKIIEYFGYPPIGPQSPNEHVNIDKYYTRGIDIVVISKNQAKSLEQMINTLRIDIPIANRIFVLDRCTDGSKELLERNNEFFVERTDAEGFCAGSARNLGLKYTNPEHDVLFLDGDRIPHNLNYERIAQMLYYFDISMIKNEKDSRNWFVNIPSINIHRYKTNNNVWSSAILLRRSAVNKISEVVGNGNLFDPIFDGHWGCEDEYLGDVAYSLGMISGGFPSHIYVEGTTTASNNTSDEYRNQVEKRNKLRGNLFIQPELLIGNQPYLNKDERRELVNSIVSERRNVMRNMIKHRDRE